MGNLDPAVVSVAGTLLGVIVAGSLAIAGTLLANSSARKVKSLELQHAADEVNRAERRLAYSEFLNNLDKWDLLAGDIGLFVLGFEAPPKMGKFDVFDLLTDEIPESHPQIQEAMDFRNMHNALWDRWRASLTTIRLVGSGEVSMLAERIFQNHQGVMTRMWDGDGVPDFDREPPTQEDLVGVMRFDLGLEEGYSFTIAG